MNLVEHRRRLEIARGYARIAPDAEEPLHEALRVAIDRGRTGTPRPAPGSAG